MSSNEYAKIKEAMNLLFDSFIRETARNIWSFVELKKLSEVDTPKWYAYMEFADDEFSTFTRVIDTLYPNNEKRRMDLIQQLDEAMEKLEEGEEY